jgi:hypothetical protein
MVEPRNEMASLFPVFGSAWIFPTRALFAPESRSVCAFSTDAE